ncbi:MAG: tetratricopeptide repeat protein [Methanosarcinaceae archaeon]|nr:tetratricopeptide repeat protein [Methanosarcinaceae archaeon]
MSKRSRDMAVRHLSRGVSFIEKGLNADAIDVLEQAEKDARNADFPEILSGVLQTYADLLLSEGREEEAIGRYTEAEEIIIELSRKGYDTTEQLAGISGNIAQILEKKGDRSKAMKKYEASADMYDKLLENDRNNLTYRSNAVSTLNNLGALLAEEGEHEAAQKSFQKALDLIEDGPADEKENIPFLLKKATILGNLLDLETDTEQVKDSGGKYGQLIETYRKIISMGPSERSCQKRLSMALITYGDIMALDGMKETSREMYKEAIDILERLCREKEDENECALMKVSALNKIASYFTEKGYTESAKNSLIKALGHLEVLLEEYPLNPENLSGTVAVLSEFNKLVEVEEASESKITCYGLIERLSEKLLAINPSSPPYRLNVAFSQNIKGRTLAELDRRKEAVSELTKAIDTALDIPENDTEASYCRAAISLIRDLGLLADGIENIQEKLGIYGSVLKRLEGLADIYPENSSIKADIADVLEKIGKNMLEKKDYDGADLVLAETAAIYDELLSLETDNEEYTVKLSSVLQSAGKLRRGMKNQKGALEIYLRLFRMTPADEEHGKRLDSVLTEMENSVPDTGSREELLAVYEELAGIREELLEKEPDNEQYCHKLCKLQEKIADTLIDSGRSGEGLEILCSLLSTRSQSSYHLKVIDTIKRFRLSIREKDSTEKAISDHILLLRTYDRLTDMELADAQIHMDRAGVLERLALLHDESGSLEKAKNSYMSALCAYEELHASEPYDDSLLVKTGNLKCRLASLLTDMGRAGDAKQMFRSSYDDYDVLLEHKPSYIPYHENAAYILNNLGYLLLQEGHFSEAKPLYEKALSIYVHILDCEPDNISCKANAACTLDNLGYILENMGRENDAMWMYEKARTLKGDSN